LEEEYARFVQTQPVTLTRRETDQIRALSQDLAMLWDAPSTMSADRQHVIRFLVERVELAVQGSSDDVRVTITWVGGRSTEHRVARPVRHYNQTVGFERLLRRIHELRDAGQPCAAVATQLNAEGFCPPRQSSRFNKNIVSRILRRNTPGYRPPPKSDPSMLGRDEWFASDLARKVGIAKNTLHAWRLRGWVAYRRPPGPRTLCVCWADAAELDRLLRLATAPRHCAASPPPTLTRPRSVPPQYRST
jgi:hypothetical protein